MTARARTLPTCAHGHTPDTCGPCGEDAHVRAVHQASMRAIAAPDGIAAQLAGLDVDDACAALAGFQAIRENGIAPPLLHNRNGAMRCGFCNRLPHTLDAVVCKNLLCSGRRPRCQLPEVRR